MCPHKIDSTQHYDVLILGAGLSGICALHQIRQRFPDWIVKALEAATGPGGVWHWNRYPGARFDSESVSYCYSFDKELLDEWHWKEAFSPQPETLKYLEYVCKKHNLNKDIQYKTRIRKAEWQDTQRTWLFSDENGQQYETRFFVSCLGFLSSPTLPAVPGIESFQGQAFHTSRWPADFDMSRDFEGKRVGVIGTGATGIQTITALSKTPGLKSLKVFQRTANWSAPLRNSEITPEQMADYRRDFDVVFQKCAETPGCFLHKPDPRRSCDVSDEERLATWEKLYAAPGFSKWLGVFKDTYTDRTANTLYSNFMAEKIRQRVNDPETAENLIPKDHGFGTRRVPLESGYFEAYNQAHVHLVNLRKTPIETVTHTGIKTADGNTHDLDILIFATGFDAITGAFSAIDWSLKDGRPLLGSSSTPEGEKAVWVDHRPRTFLGLTAPAMPNTMMILGPHQLFGNATRSIEYAVQVVVELLQHCKDNNASYFEPTTDAVDQWTEHVIECSKGALTNEVDSWLTGVNTNIKGKTVRSVARYAGSALEFRRRCEECRASGWQGLQFA